LLITDAKRGEVLLPTLTNSDTALDRSDAGQTCDRGPPKQITASKEPSWNLERSVIVSGAFQVSGHQVKEHHVITSPGEFDGVPPWSTPRIQNEARFGKVLVEESPGGVPFESMKSVLGQPIPLAVHVLRIQVLDHLSLAVHSILLE
jgi:hypothetical protein